MMASPMCRLCELREFRHDLSNLKTSGITSDSFASSSSSCDFSRRNLHADEINNDESLLAVTAHDSLIPHLNDTPLVTGQAYDLMTTKWPMQIHSASKDHVVLTDTDDEAASMLDDEDDYADVSLLSSYSDEVRLA
jgi:hypothetical protein